MTAPSREAEAQIARVTDFLTGPAGRDNYNRLRLIAETMSARYKMLSGWAARSGEDFLQEAISSCLEIQPDGTCLRRIPGGTSIDAALIMILRSLVSHVYNSQARRRAGEMPGAGGGSKQDNIVSFEPNEAMWDPESDRLTPQQKEEASARFEAFVAFAKSDRVVHGMLLLIMNEGLDKPASLIAQRLGVSEIEIYQARKRLASVVAKYMKQLEAA